MRVIAFLFKLPKLIKIQLINYFKDFYFHLIVVRLIILKELVITTSYLDLLVISLVFGFQLITKRLKPIGFQIKRRVINFLIEETF